MSKKILSIILTICLISMVFPVSSISVNAADHIHCVCGKTNCEGAGHDPYQKWEKWTADNDLPTEDGYWFLTSDVTMKYSWDLYKTDINLCLNGHTISIEVDGASDPCIDIDQSNLLLTDCETTGTVTASNGIVIYNEGKSNCTVNNITIDAKNSARILRNENNCTLVANDVFINGEYSDSGSSVGNYGIATLNNADIDISGSFSLTGIDNYSDGVLTTNDCTVNVDCSQQDDCVARGISNENATWYSTGDDVVANGTQNGYALFSDGTAKSFIDGSHLRGESDNRSFGIVNGTDDTDTDQVYIFNEAKIEGSTASLRVRRNDGLFASNEDNTKSFTGPLASIYYAKSQPQLGDVLVKNANISMEQKFSVVYPAGTFVKLVGTNLVTSNIEPTTTPAPTTTTAEPTTGETTSEGQTTVDPTTVGPITVTPTTEGPTTVVPTTAKPTTVAPTTAKPTTVAPTTVKPTTDKPTTVVPTTTAPITVSPSTVAPSTVAPTGETTTEKETTTKEVVTTTKKTAVKSVQIKKIKKGKKSAKVYWKKLTSKDATGYEIRYSRKKNMKKATTIEIDKVNTGSRKIKKLKRKKRYYFQIRAFKEELNRIYYSVWSKKKSIKVK